MDEQERYEQICAPAFREIRDDCKTILRILQGSNDKPGVVDDVRDLKRWRKEQERSRTKRVGIIIAIALIFVTQAAVLLRLWIWR